MWRIIYVSFIIVLQLKVIDGGLSICCLQTRKTHCMESCKKLLKFHKLSHISKRLTSIVATCPRSEVRFWECFGKSMLWKGFKKQIQRKPHYHSRSHSVCCKEAKHISCEVQCLTTKNVAKLQNENCHAHRESNFAQCVLKVQVSKNCCSGAKTNECKRTCLEYFKHSTSGLIFKSKSEIERVCGRESKQFQCAMNKSDYHNVIQDFTKCCSRGTSRNCERKCLQAIQNTKDVSKVFDALTKDCGQFEHQKPIYACMIKSVSKFESRNIEAETNMQPSGRTVARGLVYKEQCCARAKSDSCKSWCSATISSPARMGLWDTMYLSCIQNPKEAELSSCMSDVLEPCEIGGKSEMKFCTNFNNRPFELFRRSNQFGDGAAQKLYKFWSDGEVYVLDHKLIFKNFDTCLPQKFKALACLLAVKPCDHDTPQKQVCRIDCVELLSSCLNRDLTDEVPVEKICAAILPNANQTECVSVNDYINPQEKNENLQVTVPCENNPCPNGEVCVIDRSCDSKDNKQCKPYTCRRGCPISGDSQLIIPVNQLAKLSVDEHNEECYKVCECQKFTSMSQNHPPYSMFGNCRKFGCYKKQNCSYKNKIWKDNEVFQNRCNTCTCNDGTVLCTKKKCAQLIIGDNNDRSRRHHTLEEKSTVPPCNCESMYMPVCGKNGMTYPNSCVAKCCHMGDGQMNAGDCQAVNPCEGNPCTHGLKCIPKKNVCLSLWPNCPQYTCYLQDTPARYFGSTPPCAGAKASPLCGFDGATYGNNCLADKAGTGVDYYGPCVPNGITLGKDRCEHIKCPDVTKVKCELVIPPGSCCPICGSILRILYSQNDLTRHQNYISYEPITVLNVVQNMRQLLRVSECSLYGQLTIEGDLMILVVVNTDNPTRAQTHACNTEAQKFNKYINSRSPMMVTNYYLSVLKASKVKTAKWTVGSSSTLIFNRIKTYTILLMCLSFTGIWLR